MKKRTYIILAVLISIGLTVIQIMIADSVVKKNKMIICTAVQDIKKGSILSENDIRLINVYKENAMSTTVTVDYMVIPGKTAARDIAKDSIITERDIFSDYNDYKGMRFLAVEVSGDSFNAGDLESGDFVDIYIIPSIDELDDTQIIWLNDNLSRAGISYIPGKDPGILVENICISHINTSTGQTAKYVSIRVPKPLDEVVAFLEHISTFEFIKK